MPQILRVSMEIHHDVLSGMIQILVAMFQVYAGNLIAVMLSGSANDRGSRGLAITGEELAAL